MRLKGDTKPPATRSFQFTHPGRGATTAGRRSYATARRFNSRTPGGVRPSIDASPRSSVRRFNSRTPGGVRPLLGGVLGYLGQFQFTHPGRGATSSSSIFRTASSWFQFTHPGRGATLSTHILCTSFGSFNSRTPGGVRQGALRYAPEEWVSIHAPREGCDDIDDLRRLSFDVSIHAPREGCDRRRSRCGANERSCFNSRTPGGVRQRTT